MNTNETIGFILNSELAPETTYRYKNTIVLSGWVIRKPKFILSEKSRVESCSLLLFQINKTTRYIKIDSFSCLAFDKIVVEELKKLNYVTYIGLLGVLRYSKKAGLHIQITSTKVLKKTKLPLTAEYGKEDI